MLHITSADLLFPDEAITPSATIQTRTLGIFLPADRFVLRWSKVGRRGIERGGQLETAKVDRGPGTVFDKEICSASYFIATDLRLISAQWAACCGEGCLVEGLKDRFGVNFIVKDR